MATHSSVLAWRIPWTEEPGRLQSIGSQRVGHEWSELACTHAHGVLRRFPSSGGRTENDFLPTQVQLWIIKSITLHLAQKAEKSQCLWDWGSVFPFPADVTASLRWSVHRPATRLDRWPWQSGGGRGCRESDFKSEGCFFYSIFSIGNVNRMVWKACQALHSSN